jgi:hypothetical protein
VNSSLRGTLSFSMNYDKSLQVCIVNRLHIVGCISRQPSVFLQSANTKFMSGTSLFHKISSLCLGFLQRHRIPLMVSPPLPFPLASLFSLRNDEIDEITKSSPPSLPRSLRSEGTKFNQAGIPFFKRNPL